MEYNSEFNNDAFDEDFIEEEDFPLEKSEKDRKRKRIKRTITQKKKAERLSKSAGVAYYPIDKHRNYAESEEDVVHYKRRKSPQKRKRVLKKLSNRKVRRLFEEEDLQHNDYKKLFEYKWQFLD